MKVNFEGREWILDFEEITSRQALIIKAKTGCNLLEWQASLEQSDVDATNALYWLMLAQNDVNVDIDTVNIKLLKFIKAVSHASAETMVSGDLG